MSWSSEKVLLLSNATATSDPEAVLGGRYIWSAIATWSGATAQLQFLGPNGTTWVDVAGAVLTADGAVGVFIANGSSVRVLITAGPPSAVYSILASTRE